MSRTLDHSRSQGMIFGQCTLGYWKAVSRPTLRREERVTEGTMGCGIRERWEVSLSMGVQNI